MNFFSFLSFPKPAVLDYQSKYENHQFLRRWGGSVSFGGKGDAFDRDGDGMVDDALESEKFGDIIVVRPGERTRHEPPVEPEDETQQTILSYLHSNPDAKDTVSGIAHFWFGAENPAVRDVRRALAVLVAQRKLTSFPRSGLDPIYGLESPPLP